MAVKGGNLFERSRHWADGQTIGSAFLPPAQGKATWTSLQNVRSRASREVGIALADALELMVGRDPVELLYYHLFDFRASVVHSCLRGTLNPEWARKYPGLWLRHCS